MERVYYLWSNILTNNKPSELRTPQSEKNSDTPCDCSKKWPKMSSLALPDPLRIGFYAVLLMYSYKGVSRAFKLWEDLRPRGQSLDQKFLLQHYIDPALASFIAKILLDP